MLDFVSIELARMFKFLSKLPRKKKAIHTPMSTPAENRLDLASIAISMRALSEFHLYMPIIQTILMFKGIALAAAKAAEQNLATQQPETTTSRYESGYCL
jgi:hypothetical protein